VSKTSHRKACEAARRKQSEHELMKRANRAALLAFGGLFLVVVPAAWFIFTRTTRSHEHGPRTIGQDEEVLIDLENERCPVCGRPADGATTVTWHHLRVHLDQTACEEAFAKEQERRLDACCAEWRAAAAAVRTVNHATGERRDQALADARKSWHVVLPGERGAQ
jgi:ABC-type nickel/cobalt efflux system permease component RcnA